MLIENAFHVDLPVDRTWEILSDLSRIAPCMPGAELTSVEGDEHHGVVKVRVGSITTQYRGTARLQEADAAAHRLVVEARGHETRGQGRASATITAQLASRDGGTDVEVATELQISGRVAQFGRGVLQDVSAKLMDQFVDALKQEVGGPPQQEATGADDAAPATTAPTTAAPAPPATTRPAAATEPLDLVALGGASVLRRAAPALAALLAVVLAVVVLRRRGRRG